MTLKYHRKKVSLTEEEKRKIAALSSVEASFQAIANATGTIKCTSEICEISSHARSEKQFREAPKHDARAKLALHTNRISQRYTVKFFASVVKPSSFFFRNVPSAKLQ